MSIHLNLKKAREQRNLSQRCVADKLHISQNAYSAIETGKTKMDIKRMFQLVEILGVAFTELVIDSGASSSLINKERNKEVSYTHANPAQIINSENIMLIELLRKELDLKNEQISMLHKLLEQIHTCNFSRRLV